MKWTWLQIFEEPEGRLPIYVELRRLNNFTNIDIPTFLRNTIIPTGSGLNIDVFSELCSNGRFIFLFDGFDELRRDARAEVESQILHLCQTYEDCGFAISSRNDSRFGAWQDFHIYKAQPFNKKQVQELISKFDLHDKIVKKKISRGTKRSLLGFTLGFSFNATFSAHDAAHIQSIR